MDSKETKSHILAFFTVFVWGTTFISTKILLKTFTPVEILFIRFAIGFITLIILYPKKVKIKEKTHEIYFAIAGITGVTLYYLFENMAINYSLASNVGVIVSIAPLFTALFAHIFLKSEKLKSNFFIGFIFAIAGIAIISFNGKFVLKLNPLGDILAILSAIMWGIYSVVIKRITTFGYKTIIVTRKMFLYGIIFMIPELFFMGFNVTISELLMPVNLFNILFLSFLASAICFITWNYATKVLGAITTNIYIYIVPVITVITAKIVLNENITPVSVLGIALTLAGVAVSQLKIKTKE